MLGRYVNNASQEIQNRLKDWANEPSVETKSFTSNLKKSAIVGLLTRFVGQAIPFSTRNGFYVVDVGKGYVKAAIPLKRNRNHFNAMYAGALFTVAELPGGIITLLSFDERFFPILVDLKMEFVKMAKSDVTVEFSLGEEELAKIEADTLALGKGQFTLQGEVKDKSGEVVAVSKAHYQVRLKK